MQRTPALPTQASSYSTQGVVVAATDATLIVGPIPSPTFIRQVQLIASNDGAIANNLVTYRVWISPSGDSQTAPQPGDLELTRGATSWRLFAANTGVSVGFQVDWRQPSCFVLVRIGADAARDTRVLVQTLTGGVGGLSEVEMTRLAISGGDVNVIGGGP